MRLISFFIRFVFKYFFLFLLFQIIWLIFFQPTIPGEQSEYYLVNLGMAFTTGYIAAFYLALVPAFLGLAYLILKSNLIVRLIQLYALVVAIGIGVVYALQFRYGADIGTTVGYDSLPTYIEFAKTSIAASSMEGLMLFVYFSLLTYIPFRSFYRYINLKVLVWNAATPSKVNTIVDVVILIVGISLFGSWTIPYHEIGDSFTETFQELNITPQPEVLKSAINPIYSIGVSYLIGSDALNINVSMLEVEPIPEETNVDEEPVLDEEE